MADPQMIPTRVELMERIETAWAELNGAIADLDQRQLSTMPAAGGWSINDHLAHLAVWINSAAAILAGESRPEAMGVDFRIWERGDEDEINAAIEACWRGRTSVDVATVLQTAQSRPRDPIGGMSDEVLALPYSHFQPDSPPYNPNPVVGWIASNSFGHADLHLPAILEIRRQVT